MTSAPPVPGHAFLRAASSRLPQNMKDLGRRSVLSTRLLPRSLRYRAVFSAISKYLFFVGYPRSGSTLFGAMLNAHPNIVIGHELNALNYVRIGLHRYAIYYLLLRRDHEFAMLNRMWAGYNYNVPGQWQGRFAKLTVIGDKKSGGSTVLLCKYPGLLDDTRRHFKAPIRVIHYIRNPFDNIATIAKREGKTVAGAMQAYFSNVSAIQRVRKQLHREELLELFHEDTIGRPRESLRAALTFLELPDFEDYIEACASIVFAQPRRTRYGGDWTHEEIEAVKRRCAEVDFLRRYDFHEDG